MAKKDVSPQAPFILLSNLCPGFFQKICSVLRRHVCQQKLGMQALMTRNPAATYHELRSLPIRFAQDDSKRMCGTNACVLVGRSRSRHEILDPGSHFSITVSHTRLWREHTKDIKHTDIFRDLNCSETVAGLAREVP